jgi:predicted O-methyltransferase YrrM
MPANRELLASVMSARRRLAESGPPRLRAAGDFERVALPNRDCDVLRDVLVEARPHVVIEIGLAYGSSALAIAEALVGQDRQTKHVIIDAYQDRFHNVGWEAIVSAGLGDRCTLVAERSQLALPRLLTDGVVADAAFVDGSHAFHNVFVDLYFLRELVRPGGLIILDDCQWPSVATAVRYFEVNSGWQSQPMAIERDLGPMEARTGCVSDASALGARRKSCHSSRVRPQGRTFCSCVAANRRTSGVSSKLLKFAVTERLTCSSASRIGAPKSTAARS